MKSYTDLAQSQILAKIMPIESADSVIVSIGDREGVKTITIPKETFNILRTPFTDIRNTIPCWSLSALLSFLPRPDLHQTKGGQWYCVAEPNRMYFSKHCDNPIDACVDMIVKLTEEVKPVPLNSKILEENGIELCDNRPQHYDLAKYFKSEE